MEGMEQVLESLKAKGIESALIRQDGLMVHSTLTVDEATPGIIASLANITDELMKQGSDQQKEVEITVDTMYFVAIPVRTFLLCGIVKDRELKKDLREAAAQIRKFL